MKRIARNATKTTLLYSIESTKRLLNKHPGLKNRVKRVLSAQLSSSAIMDKTYSTWVRYHFPDSIAMVELMAQQQQFSYRPLVSIVVPTYNTDLTFLGECLDSVLSQAYDNWELCIVDDASTKSDLRDYIKTYAQKDARIKYKFLDTNKHIAGATNEGIKLATGDFISLFDHDDILWPNALYEVVKALNQDKTLDFLYSDEDKITEDRHNHLGPFFKPDWNPDFLHSVNYITHFSTIRKSVLEELGGLRSSYDGAQDWDLFLRVTTATKKIHHIPKIIYSWRIHEKSTAMSTDSKPYVVQAQKKALQDDLTRRGYPNAIVSQDEKHNGYWKVTHHIVGEPIVSIVIPSKNQYKVVKRCLESIYKYTTYKKFEIILVDTGSTDKKVRNLYDKLAGEHANFVVTDWPEQPFSYSRSCNKGAEAASGEFLIMLNNDTEVITPNWIELLLGDAQREEIGAVGCLLFFPDGKHVQHAGVGVGLGGVAANSFAMMTLDKPMSQTQHLMINTKHNMTVVTAACMMVRKKLFTEVGGFDEKFRITYNDVDLCLRIYDKGYQNLYTPHVRLIHHESISVGLPEEVKKRDTSEFKTAVNLFKSRWSKYIQHDPNINPNLSKDDAFYEIRVK